MSITLIYQQGRFATPHEQKFIDGYTRKYYLRNAKLWKGEVENYVDYVYTNHDGIARAYKAKGAEVFPIPTGEREKSKLVPRVKAEPQAIEPEPEPEAKPAAKKTTRQSSAKPRATTTKRTSTKKS